MASNTDQIEFIEKDCLKFISDTLHLQFSVSKRLDDKLTELKSKKINALDISSELRSKCLQDINHFFDSVDDQIVTFITDQIVNLKVGQKDILSNLNEIRAQWNLSHEHSEKNTQSHLVNIQAILDKAKQIRDSYAQLCHRYDDISIQIVQGTAWDPLKAVEFQLNGVRKIPKGETKDKPNIWNDMSTITDKHFTKNKEIDLPTEPGCVRFIDEKLWVGIRNAVKIFDLDLKLVNEWTDKEWNYVNDIVQIAEKDFVIIGSKCLFHVNSNGTMIDKIDSGIFSSGAYHNGSLYVYEYNLNSVIVYTYNK